MLIIIRSVTKSNSSFFSCAILYIRHVLWSTSMMTMMNCLCGMVDRRKAFGLISSRDHCQRSSPSRISDTPRAGFEPEFRLSWMKLCSSDNHYTTAPQLWQWSPNFPIFFFFFSFCAFSYNSCCSFVNNLIFLFLKLIIFVSCSLKHSQYFFVLCNLELWIHHAYFLCYDDFEDIEKLDGICLPTVVVDKFSGLFLHPSIFFVKHSRFA